MSERMEFSVIIGAPDQGLVGITITSRGLEETSNEDIGAAVREACEQLKRGELKPSSAQRAVNTYLHKRSEKISRAKAVNAN